jgi:hypothetical protein
VPTGFESGGDDDIHACRLERGRLIDARRGADRGNRTAPAFGQHHLVGHAEHKAERGDAELDERLNLIGHSWRAGARVCWRLDVELAIERQKRGKCRLELFARDLRRAVVLCRQP